MKKIFSLFLTIAMVVGLIPSTAVPLFAADAATTIEASGKHENCLARKFDGKDVKYGVFDADTTTLSAAEGEHAIYCMLGNVTLKSNVEVDIADGSGIYVCTGGYTLDMDDFNFINNSNGSLLVEDRCSGNTDTPDAIKGDVTIVIKWNDMEDANKKRPDVNKVNLEIKTQDRDAYGDPIADKYIEHIMGEGDYANAAFTVDSENPNIWTYTFEDVDMFTPRKSTDNKDLAEGGTEEYDFWSYYYYDWEIAETTEEHWGANLTGSTDEGGLGYVIAAEGHPSSLIFNITLDEFHSTEIVVAFSAGVALDKDITFSLYDGDTLVDENALTIGEEDIVESGYYEFSFCDISADGKYSTPRTYDFEIIGEGEDETYSHNYSLRASEVAGYGIIIDEPYIGENDSGWGDYVHVFYVTLKDHSSHYICGAATCTHGKDGAALAEHTAGEWAEFYDMYNDSPYRYLTEDIIITEDTDTYEINIIGQILMATDYLCLNGKTLDMGGWPVVVFEEDSLNICDCSSAGTGKFIGASNPPPAEGTASFCTHVLGTMTMYSGTFDGQIEVYDNTVSGSYYAGTFELNGGTLQNSRGNTTVSVIAENANAVFNGGKVINSYESEDEGSYAVVAEAGTLTIGGDVEFVGETHIRHADTINISSALEQTLTLEYAEGEPTNDTVLAAGVGDYELTEGDIKKLTYSGLPENFGAKFDDDSLKLKLMEKYKLTLVLAGKYGDYTVNDLLQAFVNGSSYDGGYIFPKDIIRIMSPQGQTAYVLKTLNIGNGDVDFDIAAGYTFNMPANAVTVTATFEDNHSHYICGATTCTHGEGGAVLDEHKAGTWTALTSESDIQNIGSGCYYLANNISCTDDIYTSMYDSGAITICLNGKTLSVEGSMDGAGINLGNSGVTLNICDCSAAATGVIEPNTAAGRAISTYLAENITVNLFGGTLKGFTHGAVYADKGNVVNMYDGCTITQNQLGVVLLNNSIFNMYGGSITENTNTLRNGETTYGKGAGVSATSGEVNLYGGSITKNKVDGNFEASAGIYFYDSGKITINGNPVIKDNTCKDTTDNIRLELNGNAVITVIEAANVTEGAYIGINSENDDILKGKHVVVKKGGDYAKYFHSDVAEYALVANSDGDLVFKYLNAHEHPICGDADCTDTNHTDKEWAELDIAELNKNGGYFYLKDAFTANRKISITSNTYLCLNGKTLDMNGYGFEISDYASLTLCDCVGGGVIDMDEDFSLRVTEGSMTMYGGKIVACESDDDPDYDLPVIRVGEDGKLTIGGDAEFDGETHIVHYGEVYVNAELTKYGNGKKILFDYRGELDTETPLLRGTAAYALPNNILDYVEWANEDTANGRYVKRSESDSTGLVYLLRLYKITLSESENGSIEIKDTTADAAVQSGGFVSSENEIVLTVEPDENFELDTLLVRYFDYDDDEYVNVTYTKQADGTYKFAMPENNVTITAAFKEATASASATVAVVGADGNLLERATVQLIVKEVDGKDQGEIVDEWTSDKSSAHSLDGISAGSYAVWITVAPDGYLTFDDATLVIGTDGSVTYNGSAVAGGNVRIELKQTEVKLRFENADGDTLAGTTVELLNSKGERKDRWTSNTSEHSVKGLLIGEQHTLKVTAASNGYAIPADVKFSLGDAGEVELDATASNASIKDGVLVIVLEEATTEEEDDDKDNDFIPGIIILLKKHEVIVQESEGGTVVSSHSTAVDGASVTLTVDADEGYELDSVSVSDRKGNALTVTDIGGGKYTFTMPSKDVYVTAEFTKKDDTPTEPPVEPIAPEKPDEPDVHVCPSKQFYDVDTTLWYHEAIDFVLENEYMNGVGGGRFEPTTNLSRAMIVQVLYNMEGRPAVTTVSSFEDVAADAWYYDAINWAAANDIVKGYSTTEFAPNDPITREQMAAILYRYAEYKGIDVTLRGDISSFTDGAATSEWAFNEMLWAVGVGLVGGKGNGILDPNGTATRAEVAQILMNYCTKVFGE